jgi:hypothetical protein
VDYELTRLGRSLLVSGLAASVSTRLEAAAFDCEADASFRICNVRK